MDGNNRGWGQYLLEENWIGIEAIADSLGPRYTPVSDERKVFEAQGEGDDLCGRLMRFEDDKGGLLDVDLSYVPGPKRQTLEVTSTYCMGGDEGSQGSVVTKRMTENFDNPYSLFGCAVELMSSAMGESRLKAQYGNLLKGYRKFPSALVNGLRQAGNRKE